MRPQLHKLLISPDASFVCQKWECNYFDKPWHFHKEYELVLIEQTNGTRFIGDRVNLFDDGDLALIGPNIPHLYRNSEDYYKDTSKVARSFFIHFTEDFLGRDFFDLPEMKQVRRLLNSASLGLDIRGRTNQYVSQKLKEMVHDTSVHRLMKLLDILVYLSTSDELHPILSKGFTAVDKHDAERINMVFQFIMKNFRNEIYVEQIAEKMNMSVAAFSRYFKLHTRKTFSNYITEIRISHACRLLMENNYSTSEISYLSGFENQSNFYRHFKKYTGLVPKDYKHRFLSSRS